MARPGKFIHILFSVQNEPVEADLASNIIIVSGWFFSMTHSELREEGLIGSHDEMTKEKH